MPTSPQILVERRKHPRHPIEAQVTALFSEFWRTGEADANIGWTYNVSAAGVCFSLPFRIPGDELILHIDYESMGAEYVLATIVHTVDRQEHGWQYHCRIDKTLLAIGLWDCLDEIVFDPVESGAP